MMSATVSFIMCENGLHFLDNLPANSYSNVAADPLEMKMAYISQKEVVIAVYHCPYQGMPATLQSVSKSVKCRQAKILLWTYKVTTKVSEQT